MGEDCLYLNVWAPADGRKDMPVFVWYFGGGLQVGYSAEMEFDGERIARRGIVVVTINYRVNAFGFMTHPEIQAEAPDKCANFGFMDQQAATRWVKRNIAAFGGDPENITIGGQSAGGMSVSTQLICPENKGLFRNAIIESGTFLFPYPSQMGLTIPMEQALENGKKFFEFLGVRSLKEARAIDEVTLRDKACEWMGIHGFFGAFCQALDGNFCRCDSQLWYNSSDCVPVNVLMGHTTNEFFSDIPAEDEESLTAFARENFGSDAPVFLSFFTHPATKESILREGRICAIEFATRMAARKREGAQPLYYYCFDAPIPGWDHPGTFHSVDLWFFFESLAKCWRPFKGLHYDLARQMCDYWCNFIKTGDPNGCDLNGEALPVWPRAKDEAPVRMRFGDTSLPEACPPSPLMKWLLDRREKML